MKKFHHRKINGFSLIEFVLVITLIGFIVYLPALLLNAGFNNYFKARQLNENSYEAAISTERLLTELRELSQLITIKSGRIKFRDKEKNLIVYEVKSDGLFRQFNTENKFLVVPHLQQFKFSAFDNNLHTTRDKKSIQYIQIHMQFLRGENSSTVQSTVFLRDKI